ncbi:MAG: NIPSNAP family protein [Saprospiraceae bacterium]
MKLIILFFAFMNTFLSAPEKADQNYYELRTYHCHPGKLNDLIARFQNHTTKIFENHGMKNIGYWLPTAADNNDLVYMLSYPSKAAREQSWKDFSADPEWKKVQSESEANGKIVASVESVFLNAEDFSPKIKKSIKSTARTFELRIYSCYPGKFPDIEKRFKEHTMKIFKSHDITNIAYFKSMEKDGGQSKLVYMIAHANEEAAKKSWDAFRADPEWIKVKDASEVNGKIVENVKSVMMKPLSFSKYQ